MRELIIGGARSGKSALAEQHARAAQAAGMEVLYLATARAGDGEMAQRIVHHRARRPAEWGCMEEPLALAETLRQQAAATRCILVDCLTLWLSNLFFSGVAACQAEAGERVNCPVLQDGMSVFLETLPTLPGRIILVSNELGWGVVPANPLARQFADAQGRLNQQVAAVCEQVTLVAAGLPLRLKPAAS